MRYACNFKIDIYNPEGIIDKSPLWCKWRHSWIYGAKLPYPFRPESPAQEPFTYRTFRPPSSLPNTVHCEDPAPPTEGDWDLLDDVFGDYEFDAENDDGGETSRCGASGGEARGSEDGRRNV